MEKKELQDFLNVTENTPCHEFHAETGIDLPEEEAAELTRRYRKEHGLKTSPAYFIGIKQIDKFWGVPGVQGLRIYPGKSDKGKDVLIIVAATQSGGKSYDVLEYSYTIFNDSYPPSEKKEHSGLKDGEDEEPVIKVRHENAPILVAKPCPPPNPCPPRNRLNSDS